MGLLIALIAIPVVEIVVFLSVADAIGWLSAFGVVLATALLGGVVIKSQGVATLARAQAALARAEDPSGSVAQGALVALGGVLLVSPGFVADAIGLALLAPPVRTALIRALGPRLRGRVFVARWSATGGAGAATGDVEDSEYGYGARRFGEAGGGPGGWTRGRAGPVEESAIDAEYIDITDASKPGAGRGEPPGR